MTPAEFISKWRKAELRERQASQSHFLDLRRLVDHPYPVIFDPTGEEFYFERGAAKRGGGDGWADVWKRGFFERVVVSLFAEDIGLPGTKAGGDPPRFTKMLAGLCEAMADGGEFKIERIRHFNGNLFDAPQSARAAPAWSWRGAAGLLGMPFSVEWAAEPPA